MARVYSDTLFIAHAVSSVNITVPFSERWVARTISCFWPGSSLAPAAQIIDYATSATMWYAHQLFTTFSGTFTIEPDCRIVFQESTVLTITGVDSPDIVISGYRLQLP